MHNALVLLIVWLGFGLSPDLKLAAQEPSSVESNRGVGLFLEPQLKITSVAESGRIMVGGWGGFELYNGIWLGGGGYGLTERVGLTDASTEIEVVMGYGGLIAEYRWYDPAWGTVGARLLLGAGNVDVRASSLESDVDSDNFLVLEPELTTEFDLPARLTLVIAGGYRIVSGVEDVPKVRDGDLEAFTLSLGVRIGIF